MAHDPYAPHPRRQPVANRLPTARLRRLGATDRCLAILGLWFDEMSAAGRDEYLIGLAGQPDASVAAHLVFIDDLANASASSVQTWVERDDDPVEAARLALVVEATRPQPRSTLVAKLEKIVAQ